MKKYLIIGTFLIIVLVLFLLFHYQMGIFIDFHPNKEVSTIIKINGKDFYLKKGKDFEYFEIKGVDMGAGIPGHFATEFKIDKETYKRWFKYIKEMGANTIRVYTILNTDFYQAFYEYNKDNDDPLYLIHGLWVNDYVQFSRLNAYSKEFRNQMLSDSKKLIDVIHGKRLISIGNESGTGFYTKDISDWVIGYILGVEWEDVTVEYTNHLHKEKTEYKGEYFYTDENATPFEVFLAEIGDKFVDYESTRYKIQKAVAFSNWPTTDPFDYSEGTSKYLKKFSKVDVEHIKTTNKFLSGQFASYHIYPYYPDYLNYEEEYNNYKDENGIKNTYKAYLNNINKHHTIPVVISEYGVPSSRGLAQKEHNAYRNQGGMSEKEQGQALVDCYKDMKDIGINNSIIFTWHDEWFKRTWNTMHSVTLTRTPYWSDYQTNEQYFGLLSFDPGKNESICYTDGDNKEWKKEDIVYQKKDLSLSMKYDEKYIYFYINKKNYNNEKIFIPIDITNKSGSKKVDGINISFDRDVDFLILIDGKDNSRILVQDRYNNLDAMFSYEIYGNNSFIDPPNKNSSKFTKINMILQTATQLLSDDENAKAEVFETGKLIYGIGNPNKKDFNSKSDFYINKDTIELRLPWQILNFSDPSRMKIHNDYYEKYGVEDMSINKMYVGVGLEKDNIKLNAFKLKGWGNKVTYHERLKDSYYIIKELWGDK